MKNYLLTAAIAAMPLAMADISMGTGSAPEPPEVPSAELQEQIDLAKAVIQSFKDLTTTLNGITDQASADAAAAQVSSQIQRMQELQRKAESAPQPTASIEAQMQQHINVQEVRQTVNTFMEAIIRLGMNSAYGSEALMQALSPLMNPLTSQSE